MPTYTIINARSNLSVSDLTDFRYANDPAFHSIPLAVAQRMIQEQLDRGDIYFATDGTDILGTGSICRLADRQRTHKTKSLYEEITRFTASERNGSFSQDSIEGRSALRNFISRYTGNPTISDIGIQLFVDCEFAKQGHYPQDDDVFLSNLNVSRNHRRQGIATALVEFRVAKALLLGATTAYVSANEGSKLIYDKMGFEPMMHASSWFGKAVTHMGKRLIR